MIPTANAFWYQLWDAIYNFLIHFVHKILKPLLIFINGNDLFKLFFTIWILYFIVSYFWRLYE